MKRKIPKRGEGRPIEVNREIDMLAHLQSIDEMFRFEARDLLRPI
jgi:hypothetical protein